MPRSANPVAYAREVIPLCEWEVILVGSNGIQITIACQDEAWAHHVAHALNGGAVRVVLETPSE